MDQPQPIRVLDVDQLRVRIYDTRQAMGVAAAQDVASQMQQLLKEQPHVRMIFAAAPSQNEFLASLGTAKGLDWGRVEAFHMDDYVGLPEGTPQRFSTFLRDHLFDQVRPGRVEYIRSEAPDVAGECERYETLLRERPIDIVCAGIGENGHLAFNDPPVADFEDNRWVKQVTLDEVCRLQQVHDGAFPTIEAVPRVALTLTIPALMAGQRIYCLVPGPTKTAAVRCALRDAISTACPATVMRRHPRAILYLDKASAAGL
jgi:glucosamine-6-phosphate deaminase